MVDDAIRNRTREDWIVMLKETNEPIGFGGFVHIDWKNRKAEPSLALGKNHWGGGLGTEIVHKFLDFGLNGMGLNRILCFRN